MRRQATFMTKLADELGHLADQVNAQGERILSQDERFVTIAIEAIHAAARTHSEEKHQALLNAVLNSIDIDVSDDLATMLIGFVADLTPTHLRILAILDAPPPGRAPGTASSVTPYFPAIWEALTPLGNDEYTTLQFVEGLAQRGLVPTPSGPSVTLQVTADHAPVTERHRFTTLLGRQLLQFIANATPTTDDR